MISSCGKSVAILISLHQSKRFKNVFFISRRPPQAELHLAERRDEQAGIERRSEGEAKGRRRGHRPVQPVTDELAEIDDVLALPGRGQECLGGLRVEVVGEHVADAAEEFQQHNAQVRRIEVRPAVRQLRHAGEQFTSEGFIVLVRVIHFGSRLWVSAFQFSLTGN